MTTRSLSLIVAALIFGAIMQPQKTQAAIIGQPCVSPGTTQMSDDERDVLVCLYYGPHSLVWSALAVKPQYAVQPAISIASASATKLSVTRFR